MSATKPRTSSLRMIFWLGLTGAAILLVQGAQAVDAPAATAVSSGDGHTCVLKSTGNVVCYGNSYDAQPYNGGDATAVDAAQYYTCVLKSNKNVDCYGDNMYGQGADYLGGDATAVSAAYTHTCVRKTNSRVDCYGDNTYGQGADYLTGDATAVSVGAAHTCVRKTNSNVDCYGDNSYGQGADYLGGDATAVSAGFSHTCILKSNGNVDCYGSNGQGQAADYAGGDATAVSAGDSHTCILKSNGNVDCYGLNNYGQSEDYLGGDATAVSAGILHTCVRKSNGNVDCYGDNTYGKANDYGIPSAPTVTATPLSNQVTLTWTAPSSNDASSITNYKVYRGATSGSEVLVTTGGCSSLGNVLTCTDSGLGEGTTRYYKLSARNSVGEGWQSTEISATTLFAPSAPRSLSASGGSNQITLTWQAPSSSGSSSITNYKVYRGTTSGTETLLTSGGCSGLANVLTCTDAGLGSGVTRYYKVSAVSSAGEGVQSNEASATTIDPPSAPQNLAAGPGSLNGEITLTWQAPASNGGGAITAYKVYRGATSGSEVLVTSGGCAALGNVLSCVDGGLGNGVTRYYQVRAANAAGDGPLGNEAVATTFNAPTAPQSLSASAGPVSGQITLTWQAPSSNGGQSITSYKVYSSSSSGTETLVTSGGCANLGFVLSCADEGLGNGATRYYKVSAVNGVGESLQSGEASATTYNTPTAPQNLAATTGSAAGQITLTWQAPAQNGGLSVTNYVIYSAASSGAETAVASGGCSSLGNVLTCTDSGLGNGVTRYYKVAAKNDLGESAQSGEASAQTLVFAPSAPQGLTANVGPDVGDITLSWIPPADNGGASITSYRVYRGTSPTSNSPVASGGCADVGVALSCTDSTCPGPNVCFYQVTATNQAGEGPRSGSAVAPSTAQPQACPGESITQVPPTCLADTCQDGVGVVAFGQEECVPVPDSSCPAGEVGVRVSGQSVCLPSPIQGCSDAVGVTVLDVPVCLPVCPKGTGSLSVGACMPSLESCSSGPSVSVNGFQGTCIPNCPIGMGVCVPALVQVHGCSTEAVGANVNEQDLCIEPDPASSEMCPTGTRGVIVAGQRVCVEEP